jgi:hypothetical protein
LDVGLGGSAFLPSGHGLRRGGSPLVGPQIEGIYTHLHGGDEPGYLGWQLDRFYSALADSSRRASIYPVRLAESSVTLGLEGRADAMPSILTPPVRVRSGWAPRLSGIRPAFVSLEDSGHPR